MCDCKNTIIVYRHNGHITIIVRNLFGTIKGFTEKTAKGAMTWINFFFGLGCKIDKASATNYLDLLLSIN